MRETTWAALERKLASPILKASPVPREEIDDAARSLKCVFHKDYIEFLLRYGGAVVGPNPVFGLRQPEVMGKPWSVVDVTNMFRADGRRGISEWYIISNDGFGNPIGLAPDGRVWISDHDAGD